MKDLYVILCHVCRGTSASEYTTCSACDGTPSYYVTLEQLNQFKTLNMFHPEDEVFQVGENPKTGIKIKDLRNYKFTDEDKEFWAAININI